MKYSIKKRVLSLITALCVTLCALSCLSSCAKTESGIIGDCNNDGKVNAFDSNFLRRYVGGANLSISKINADINKDGLQNEADRALLCQFISGSYLPGDRFEKIYLNGIDISEYAIVIPENHNDFEKWTADILADTLNSMSGADILVVGDNEPEQEHEILVGRTARAASIGTDATAGQYLVYAVGSKIVMKGENYLIGAGAGDIITSLESSSEPWNGVASVDISTEIVSRTVQWESPENVFFFIGDGMGLCHTQMATDPDPVAEYANGVLAIPDEKTFETFWPSTFDHIGDSVTLNIQNSTTDSAASATALSTGYKTLNGALGMVPADLDGDGKEDEFRSVQNVREAATLRGKATAVLSTDKPTGATPNAFLTHHYTRKDRSILLEQQKALEKTRLACNYMWCSYDSNEILTQFIEAVDTCNDNPGGFFIMTEEAMIDKFGEKMDYDNVIRTVKRLNSMTAYAATYAMCHRDTLIVITADHETGGLILGDDGVWRWTSDGEHTAKNVPVFAMGYGTEYFNMTTRDNTEIAKFLFDAVEK